VKAITLLFERPIPDQCRMRGSGTLVDVAFLGAVMILGGITFANIIVMVLLFGSCC